MHAAAPSPAFARVEAENNSEDDFLTIEIGGRTAQVFRPVVKGVRLPNYYLKGYPPGWGKKALYRSTGFSTKGMALPAAKTMWKAALDKRLEALDATKLRQPKAELTIGKLLEAHKTRIHTVNLTVEEATAQGYRNALRRVVAWAHFPDMMEACERLHLDKDARARIDELTVKAALTEAAVESFLRAYVAPAGADYQEKDRRINGALATLRLARSLFDGSAKNCYRGLDLPDLTGFLEANTPRAPKLANDEITPAVMKVMAAAAVELRESNPTLYLVHLLFRHCGMRNDEIENARVGWFTRADDVKGVTLANGECRVILAFVNIRQSGEWSPKASEGRVPLSPCVWAELQRWIDGRTADEYLVPATTKTARWELINIAHNDFVRPWLGGFRKRSYELRRWAATIVANTHQSGEMAEHFLRHAPRTTAGKHYLTKRPTPAPVMLSDAGC